MKNTLTINADNDCKCECLDKLDDGSNSIWLNIVTSIGGRVEFIHGDATYTVSVIGEPIKIPPEWYLTDDLKFRFVDEHHTGDYFTLYHPTTTKGDLVLSPLNPAQPLGFKYEVRFYEPSTGGGGGGEYTLPPASTTTLGGIIVGDGLSVKSDGTLSADAQKIDVDSALSTTSENPVQNKVITARLDEVFTSVSDGKSAIASAITDKGVYTGNGETFNQMASNILRINQQGAGGVNVYLSDQAVVFEDLNEMIGCEVSTERVLKYKYGDVYLPKLPDYAYQILRKNDQTGYYDCFVTDGTFTWVSDSRLESYGTVYFYRVIQTANPLYLATWDLYSTYSDDGHGWGNGSDRVMFWVNRDILDSDGNVKMTAGTVVVE